MMERIETPQSSLIEWFGYDRNGEELQVRLRYGRTAVHRDIPQELFNLMRAAKSVGRFYQTRVKPNYRQLSESRVVAQKPAGAPDVRKPKNRQAAGPEPHPTFSSSISSDGKVRRDSVAEPGLSLIPNTTQFPNVLLDRFMRCVPMGVWKVLCCVTRKTYGFHKVWDAISKSQMTAWTGLSDQGVTEIVELLLKSTLLLKGEMKIDEKGRQLGFRYRLNLQCDLDYAEQLLTRQPRSYKQRTPRKKGANSVGEGPTQLGANSVGGEGPTRVDLGANSVGPQNLIHTKPIRNKTLSPEATPDSRWKGFVDDLKTYREQLTGPGTFHPTAKDFRNLRCLLREHPELTREEFQRCLTNRALSVKAKQFNAAEEICRWISRIPEFSEGPLDKFGKPLGTTKGGNHGREKIETITNNIGEALERRRAGRLACEEAGDSTECIPRTTAIN